MTEGKLNSLLRRIIPGAVFWVMRLWFASCRVIVHNEEHFFSVKEKERNGIAAFWHYSILYIIYHMRHYSATAMVSASRDGEYLARVVEKFGFSTVRGSKNTKGVEGLKAMLRAVRRGSNAAIVADGSQGPALVVQAGCIYLAARSGVPILPMVYAASSYFTINSWDRTIIPKPFCRIDFHYGEPLFVPAEAKPEELEEYRLLLEQRLNALYKTAWEKYAKKDH